MKIIKYFSLFIILCLLLVGASFASNDTTTISNEKITTLDNTHVVSNNTCISNKDNKIQKTNEYNKIDKIKVNNTKKSDKTYDETNSIKTNTTKQNNINSKQTTLKNDSNKENSINSKNVNTSVKDKSLKQSENTNNLINVRVVANSITAHPGDNVTFNGYVVDEYNRNVSVGKLFIKINGDTYTSCIIEDNKFNCTYSIPNLNKGVYKLQYVYLQNSKYARYELNKTLNITNKLINVRVVSKSITAYPGDNVTFNGYVLDEYNRNVPVGKLFIKINGKTYTSCNIIEDNKFSCTYSIPNLKAGVYKLQYVYLQNSKYARYELNKTLTLPNKLVNVKIVAGDIAAHPGDSVNINGYVLDEYNKVVPYGKFVIKLNGKTHIITNITNNKINYTYTIPNYEAKKYNLQYVYVANDKYDRYELNKTLIINNDEKMKSTTILVGDYEIYSGGLLTMTGKVVDSNQKLVNGGKVVFKLNGNTMDSVRVRNGTFEFKKVINNFGGRIYELTFVYGVENLYDRSEANRVLLVTNKELPKVIVNASDVAGYAGEEVSIKGTVTDEFGNPINRNNLIIKINGKTIMDGSLPLYYSTINGTFEDILLIPNYSAKAYELQYVYLQTDKYERYELNKTLTIKRQPSKISFVYDEDHPYYYPADVTYIASGESLYFGVAVNGLVTGNIASSGNISLKINGKLYQINNKTLIAPIKDNMAVFKYTIPKTAKPGSVFKLTLLYSGSSNFYASEVGCTVVVQ